MIQASAIENYIQQGLACDLIRVDGDGHHWQAVIVSPAFVGQNRVKRQQLVYATVRERMESNEIHALSLKTFTPEEWEQQHG